MYLSTPNAMDTEQLFQRYFQLQDTKTRRAIILESPTLRTGPFPKPFSAADSPHITTTRARVDPALPLAAIHHLLRVFPVGQDVCNHPDPPEKATGSSAGQRVQRRAPQPADPRLQEEGAPHPRTQRLFFLCLLKTFRHGFLLTNSKKST